MSVIGWRPLPFTPIWGGGSITFSEATTEVAQEADSLAAAAQDVSFGNLPSAPGYPAPFNIEFPALDITFPEFNLPPFPDMAATFSAPDRVPQVTQQTTSNFWFGNRIVQPILGLIAVHNRGRRGRRGRKGSTAAGDKVKVSWNDALAGYLDTKVVGHAGDATYLPVTMAELNNGGDEDLQVRVLKADIVASIDPAAGPYNPAAHTLLDASKHSDTLANAPTKGCIIYGNADGKWTMLSPPSIIDGKTYMLSMLNGVFTWLETAAFVCP